MARTPRLGRVHHPHRARRQTLGTRPHLHGGMAGPQSLRFALSALVHRLRLPRRLRRSRPRHFRLGRRALLRLPRARRKGPLTWPEGNGWITKRLLEKRGRFVHTGPMVHRIAKAGTRFACSRRTEYGRCVISPPPRSRALMVEGAAKRAPLFALLAPTDAGSSAARGSDFVNRLGNVSTIRRPARGRSSTTQTLARNRPHRVDVLLGLAEGRPPKPRVPFGEGLELLEGSHSQRSRAASIRTSARAFPASTSCDSAMPCPAGGRRCLRSEKLARSARSRRPHALRQLRFERAFAVRGGAVPRSEGGRSGDEEPRLGTVSRPL